VKLTKRVVDAARYAGIMGVAGMTPSAEVAEPPPRARTAVTHTLSPGEPTMTADIESLVLEHLRAIRATQTDHGERLTSIELNLATLGQQVGALTTAVYSGKSDLEGLRRRVERIERRVELTDG
jgi:hypothetical protein